MAGTLSLIEAAFRKVPPGGICSDLFSSTGSKTELDNKPKRIDRYAGHEPQLTFMLLSIRQRSSIDFAPDLCGATHGLERQVSEPSGGSRDGVININISTFLHQENKLRASPRTAGHL